MKKILQATEGRFVFVSDEINMKDKYDDSIAPCYHHAFCLSLHGAFTWTTT